MTGPLGETHGKDGRPELPAVSALTVAEAGRQLSELAGGRACSLNLGFTRGRWVAVAEYAGSGIGNWGTEATGTGTGADAETAVRAALAGLPKVRRAGE